MFWGVLFNVNDCDIEWICFFERLGMIFAFKGCETAGDTEFIGLEVRQVFEN